MSLESIKNATPGTLMYLVDRVNGRRKVHYLGYDHYGMKEALFQIWETPAVVYPYIYQMASSFSDINGWGMTYIGSPIDIYLNSAYRHEFGGDVTGALHPVRIPVVDWSYAAYSGTYSSGHSWACHNSIGSAYRSIFLLSSTEMAGINYTHLGDAYSTPVALGSQISGAKSIGLSRSTDAYSATSGGTGTGIRAGSGISWWVGSGTDEHSIGVYPVISLFGEACRYDTSSLNVYTGAAELWIGTNSQRLTRVG